MAQAKKIYQYDAEKVRVRLKTSFQRRGREACLADLVADTALPRVQVEEQLPALADEFDARMRVTESGEMLYSFPRGMHSRYRGFGPALKRFMRGAGKVLQTILTYAFKAWIALMLVGYFVFFIALLVLFLVAGIAAQSGSKGRRSSGGINLIGSILNLFVRIWFYSEFVKGSQGSRVPVRDKKKPLHKAVYSFIFGDGDPNANWEELERKAVLAFIRKNSGIISLEEYMILSGKDPEEAATAINAYCVEFDGSPEASEDGSLYFSFPGIMRGVDVVAVSSNVMAAAPAKKLEAFSANPKSANVWFGIMNGVNILFGGFFLAGAGLWGERALILLQRGSRALQSDIPQFFYAFVLDLFSIFLANPVAAVSIGLGAVPLSFAFFFYLVPALRAATLKRRNENIKLENLRRAVYARAWSNPEMVEAETSFSSDPSLLPARASAPAKLLDELAAHYPAKIDASPTGSYRYAFPDLKRTRESLAKLRAAVNTGDYELGKTVYDTDEKPI